MRLPRFTTWRLMKFTAAFALVLAMMIYAERRRQFFLGRARESGDKFLAGVSDAAGLSREARRTARKRTAYYWQLNVKYLRAARYPWLPVASDPPEPK
jgi:hypothetical protein